MLTILMKKMGLTFLFIYLALLQHGFALELYFDENTDLYPISEPYDEGYLQVSEIHQIYYAQFGNPEGVPVIVLHGGPGAGCSASWSSFFDPSFYRVVMFDQRGAKRSTPLAEMRENNPHLLVKDIERLREYLGIDQWLVFGGSWGSALAILYGESHPENAMGFIIRGVFLAREKDTQQIFNGMRRTFPEAWDEFVQFIPKEERDDLVYAFYLRLMDPDPLVHLPAAHVLMHYDVTCGTLLPDPALVAEQDIDDDSSLSISRTYTHYAVNDFFLKENQLLNDIHKIAHLPAIIVHGRYDTICLPENAYELHKKWPGSELWFISNGAHLSSEPPIARGLKTAMDKMKQFFP